MVAWPPFANQKDEEAKGAAKFAQEHGLFVIVSPGGQSSVTTISNSKKFKPTEFVTTHPPSLLL